MIASSPPEGQGRGLSLMSRVSLRFYAGILHTELVEADLPINFRESI